MSKEIVLGCTATDIISGFSGVVTGVVHYLTGCNQALVSPQMKEDGTVREAQWFDLQRLERNAEKTVIVLDNGPAPGFDRAPPIR